MISLYIICKEFHNFLYQKGKKKLKYFESSNFKTFISYRNIINRVDLRCNYVCSLQQTQTLVDCDAVDSNRCHGRRRRMEICAKSANTNYLARGGSSEKRLLALPIMSVCPYVHMKQLGHHWKKFLEILNWDNLLNATRKFESGKNRTNRGSTEPKHLHTFVSTLATVIAMTAVDNNS